MTQNKPSKQADRPDKAGIAARTVALDVLRSVLRGRVALDDALAANEELAALTPRDRAFARMMVATAMRRLGQIDALIAECLERPVAAKANMTRDILRLSVCQLVFMRTPAHAAVDGAVRLAVWRGQAHMKGLVNAVLRRIAREGEAMAAAQDAARLNTPDWMWNSWTAAHGEAACRAIAEAHLEEPPLDFTAKEQPDHWAAQLDATPLPTGTLRRPHGGPITELPGYAAGGWWVQDAAAALPARLLIGALGGLSEQGALSEKTVIDLCAAPGGKTAQLAAAGLRVISVERAERRLERLRENLGRLGLAAEAVKADAAEWRPAEPADAVLLDAPCTATGTIRRHPDISRTKDETEVARLAGLQARLLDAAADMVRPGGVLVYGVCSLQPEEGVERVRAFLSGHDDFERLPVRAEEIGGLAEAITADGDLMTLPSHLGELGGMDGFYAARLKRV